MEDVRKAVKKLKRGKLPGVDGITSEILKCGGECLLEWLRRVCNVCVLKEKIPNDWMRAVDDFSTTSIFGLHELHKKFKHLWLPLHYSNFTKLSQGKMATLITS